MARQSFCFSERWALNAERSPPQEGNVRGVLPWPAVLWNRGDATEVSAFWRQQRNRFASTLVVAVSILAAAPLPDSVHDSPRDRGGGDDDPEASAACVEANCLERNRTDHPDPDTAVVCRRHSQGGKSPWTKNDSGQAAPVRGAGSTETGDTWELSFRRSQRVCRVYLWPGILRNRSESEWLPGLKPLAVLRVVSPG